MGSLISSDLGQIGWRQCWQLGRRSISWISILFSFPEEVTISHMNCWNRVDDNTLQISWHDSFILIVSTSLITLMPSRVNPSEPYRPSALGVLILNLEQASSVAWVWLKAHHTYFLQIIIEIMFVISKIRRIFGMSGLAIPSKKNYYSAVIVWYLMILYPDN